MSTYDTPIRYGTFYTQYDAYRTILTTMPITTITFILTNNYSPY